MGIVGLLAYRSVLNGGVPVRVPNLRNKEEREEYRNDTACCDPNVAGDALLPSFSRGNPEIDPAIYKEMEKRYLEEFEADTGYVNAAFNQSSGNEIKDAGSDPALTGARQNIKEQ
jgi:hypothetical protein